VSKDKTSGNQARAHIRIHGKVQNVGFRFFIHRKAAGAGALGWAKNADDHVEVMLEGDKDRIEQCIEACRKGPLFANIKKMDVSWEKPTGEFKSFEVI